MRRCRLGLLIVTLFVALGATLVLASPSLASTSRATPVQARLQARLNKATLTLSDLATQLQTARVALKAALASGSADDVAAARNIIRKVKPQVRKLTLRVRHLRFILEHPMSPDRHGSWMPVIRAAAKRFHLNPSSLRHMMMLESGGRTYCVTGPFLGLFQYCRGTWNGAWNQFRSYGIFNGGAQIWATATAIHRGWGPQMWPNTYPMSFR